MRNTLLAKAIVFNILADKFDPLLSHCASLMCSIFEPLARAHKRVRVQNVKDSPQTLLNSGTNFPFLLDEHGDPQFYFLISVKTISTITEKKIRGRHNGPNSACLNYVAFKG